MSDAGWKVEIPQGEAANTCIMDLELFPCNRAQCKTASKGNILVMTIQALHAMEHLASLWLEMAQVDQDP